MEISTLDRLGSMGMKEMERGTIHGETVQIDLDLSIFFSLRENAIGDPYVEINGRLFCFFASPQKCSNSLPNTTQNLGMHNACIGIGSRNVALHLIMLCFRQQGNCIVG